MVLVFQITFSFINWTTDLLNTRQFGHSQTQYNRSLSEFDADWIFMDIHSKYKI
jgi:hypothetical protein